MRKQNVLIQFILENYRSFRVAASFDFSASRHTEHPGHVARIGEERLSPVAGIIGANESGKSNVLRAFQFMAQYVFRSATYDSTLHACTDKPVPSRTPFALNAGDPSEDTLFEVFFTNISREGPHLRRRRRQVGDESAQNGLRDRK
ncbi:MAG: AAA family ATPase [Clostridia bacterium]|nr:AAA family ATPase [Clostridia bacterium]